MTSEQLALFNKCFFFYLFSLGFPFCAENSPSSPLLPLPFFLELPIKLSLHTAENYETTPSLIPLDQVAQEVVSNSQRGYKQ